MAKSYRTSMTPGIKKCIDYMKGKTVKEEKSEIKDVPPQVYKSKK
tara:strand:- start:414 stop:548 length:135 start_codon:yes stop_codon:yes gene_type:complete